MRARLPGEWARVDLSHAVTLARTLSDIEVHRKKLRREGDLLRNKVSGVAQLNPRLRLVETLARRSMALTRVLCLHARITLAGGGTKDEAVEGKAAATQAARALEGDDGQGGDDLINRPTLQ